MGTVRQIWSRLAWGALIAMLVAIIGLLAWPITAGPRAELISAATTTATQLPSRTPTVPPPSATASPTTTVTPEPSATPRDQWALDIVPPPWPIDCENEWAWDGYIFPELENWCIPGILSHRTLYAQFPRDFYGVLSSYAPHLMEYMEDRWNANYPEATVRRGQGVALAGTCGMMGNVVWLRLPGEGWRGPFRVVDCSFQAGVYYHMAVQGLAVEVGYTVAQDWVLAAQRVDVHIGSYPGADWNGVHLATWWVNEALEWETGYGYPLLQNIVTRGDGTTFFWPELE